MTAYVEEEDKIIERHYRTFDKVEFEEQEAYLHELLELPNVLRVGIDAMGMGEHMAENLEKRWGHRVLKLKGAPAMMSIATQLKMYMEKAMVGFIADQRRSIQMHSIKRSVTEKGVLSLAVGKGIADGTTQRHHGDIFWSRAMGVYAHADVQTLGEPRLMFI